VWVKREEGREMRVQALSARAERGDERQVRKGEQARWELLLGFLKAAEFSLVVYAISRVNLFFFFFIKLFLKNLRFNVFGPPLWLEPKNIGCGYNIMYKSVGSATISYPIIIFILLLLLLLLLIYNLSSPNSYIF